LLDALCLLDAEPFSLELARGPIVSIGVTVSAAVLLKASVRGVIHELRRLVKLVVAQRLVLVEVVHGVKAGVVEPT